MFTKLVSPIKKAKVVKKKSAKEFKLLQVSTMN